MQGAVKETTRTELDNHGSGDKISESCEENISITFESYEKGVIGMAKDPVCGMDVEEGKICSSHEGKKYCFCSQACKESFEKDPSKYVTSGGKKTGCC